MCGFKLKIDLSLENIKVIFCNYNNGEESIVDLKEDDPAGGYPETMKCDQGQLVSGIQFGNDETSLL